MPELPEVETTRRGLLPMLGQRIDTVLVRNPRLRQPVPPELTALCGQAVSTIERRGKYLLLQTKAGTALVHLGMSGSLRLCAQQEEPRKHDHVLLQLANGLSLRFHDPRRFGVFLWLPADHDPYQHPLLAVLGPEPLSDAFTATDLYQRARHRQIPVKSFIMDSHVVVGVGNIYAAESLFYAGIHPLTPAGQLSLSSWELLHATIRHILGQAIYRGGTTLRDFLNSDGQPGYFQQELMVYGREGEDCRICNATLAGVKIAGRSSVYCPQCQPDRRAASQD